MYFWTRSLTFCATLAGIIRLTNGSWTIKRSASHVLQVAFGLWPVISSNPTRLPVGKFQDFRQGGVSHPRASQLDCGALWRVSSRLVSRWCRATFRRMRRRSDILIWCLSPLALLGIYVAAYLLSTETFQWNAGPIREFRSVRHMQVFTPLLIVEGWLRRSFEGGVCPSN